MATEFIETQWGSKARPFQSYSEEERQGLLTAARKLIEKLGSATGIELFLSYGALLGAVRSGSLIGHDFDLDVMFVSPEGARELIPETATRLIDQLMAFGFDVVAESNGQFKASGNVADTRIMIEFFACWREGNKLFHYFGVSGDSIANSVFPLSTISLHGVEFPAPNTPPTLLKALYGENWMIPDKNFKYDLSPEDWIPFRFLFTRDNRKFWDEYYSSRKSNRVWIEVPSQFAAFVASNVPMGAKILEIGCGNGRDGLFFASTGLSVTLADYSVEALGACRSTAEQRHLTVGIEQLNVADLAASAAFSKRSHSAFDVVYARFVLHAVTPIGQHSLLRIAKSVLKPEGLLMMEYRAQQEGTDHSKESFENGVHYRRLVGQRALKDEASALGLHSSYSIEGRGFARYKSEDPWIGRDIFVNTSKAIP